MILYIIHNIMVDRHKNICFYNWYDQFSCLSWKEDPYFAAYVASDLVL